MNEDLIAEQEERLNEILQAHIDVVNIARKNGLLGEWEKGLEEVAQKRSYECWAQIRLLKGLPDES